MTLNFQISPFSEIDARLLHLEPDQIHALVGDYMGSKNVEEILETYDLKQRVNQGLNRILPPIHSKRTCAYCDHPSARPIIARSAKKKRLSEPVCINCGHTCFEIERDPLEDQICTCKTCEEIRTQHTLQVKQRTLDTLTNLHAFASAKPLSINDLTFVQTLSLLSLCQFATHNNETAIGPVVHDYNKSNFAPTKELTIKLIEDLHEHNALSISPESDTEVFNHNPTFSISDITQVTWLPNITNQTSRILSAQKAIPILFERLSGTFDSSQKNDAYQFTFDLATAELLEYAGYLKQGLQCDLPTYISVPEVFRKLLENHPVSNLMDFVVQMVETANEYDDASYSLQEADGSLQEFLEPLYRKALTGCEPHTNRGREFHQSHLSLALYESALLAGDIGFKHQLDFVWDKKLSPRFQ